MNHVYRAALALTLALTFPAAAGDAITPDHILTPGAVIATVTTAEVCQAGYTARVRHVTAATKRKVFQAYGIDPSRSAEFEIDHLISLELGGSNDIANLWPEPYNELMGARIKDNLENELHRLVCAGTIPLTEAQTAVASDWRAAYQKYMPR